MKTPNNYTVYTLAGSNRILCTFRPTRTFLSARRADEMVRELNKGRADGLGLSYRSFLNNYSGNEGWSFRAKNGLSGKRYSEFIREMAQTP